MLICWSLQIQTWVKQQLSSQHWKNFKPKMDLNRELRCDSQIKPWIVLFAIVQNDISADNPNWKKCLCCVKHKTKFNHQIFYDMFATDCIQIFCIHNYIKIMMLLLIVFINHFYACIHRITQSYLNNELINIKILVILLLKPDCAESVRSSVVFQWV